jgi:hypothetical protein
MRYVVNVYESNWTDVLIPPPVEINIAPPPQADNFKPSQTLSKSAVLSGIRNSRVKTMLASPDVKDWSAELVEGNLVSIAIVSKSGQIVKIAVSLFDNVEDVQAPVAVIPSTILPISHQGRSELLCTLSQERVLSILGAKSFLANISKSDWKVLGIKGKKIDVQLNNGLVFSMPLV